jgi:hypothetical protein
MGTACVIGTLVACGARTPLGQGSPGSMDGGPDAMPDAFIDAPSDARPDGDAMPDAGLLSVECAETRLFTTPRDPVRMQALIDGPDPIVSRRWSVEAGPDGSMATPMPPDALEASFTPDLEGLYRLRFTAEDAEGRIESCEVRVRATVGPPVAICPEEELVAPAGSDIEVRGDGFDDDMVVSYRWALVAGPGGGMFRFEPQDEPVTIATAPVAATFTLELTVTDVDGATDSCRVDVRFTAPPEVECPTSPIEAPTRRPVPLTATAIDDTSIASRRWRVLERPDDSTAEPMPPSQASTSFTPDRQGEYRLRFTATDTDGLEASCEVTVIGTPTPPDAVCPGTVDTRPLVEIELTGDGVDDGEIVEYRWRLARRPDGSDASGPAPSPARTTRFMPDIAGEYEIELTVVDDDGDSGSCRILVRAVASEGLRVEMFWNTVGTDMDLHLLRPEAVRWSVPSGSFEGDCHFSNCIRNPPDWGVLGLEEDDPRLDLDDVDGRGPENINIDEPAFGTYRVGVFAWRGSGRVTVSIYCGGSTTEPRRTFGPVLLRGRGGGGSASNDFWRVADVEIDATGCRITDLAEAGGPNITAGSDAAARR